MPIVTLSIPGERVESALVHMGGTKEQLYDVAIIGAGPAGSTLAITLMRYNPDLRVCLVDAQRFPRDKACGDGLSPGVQRVLLELDLAHLLDEFESVGDVLISSPSGIRCEGPLPLVGSDKPVGYVVPRIVFDDRLRSVALARGVREIGGARLVGAEYDPVRHLWALALRGGTSQQTLGGVSLRQLHARVLVGADGARSTVRKLLGIPFNSPRHTGVALRAYTEAAVPERGRRLLEIHFMTETLPAYAWVFPIDARRANIGVGIDVEVYKKRARRLAVMFEQFFSRWSTAGANRGWTTPTNLKNYILPYGSQLPTLAVGTAALVGDAGSMINPFTGDGISYGMAAGYMLGEGLAEALRRGTDPKHALAVYNQRVHSRFEEHFRINYRMKRQASVPFWNNMVIRAYSKDPQILSGAINLMIGEGRKMKAKNALKIALKGLW